jgi:raffinose/stachyose/melibiose transport system substrate-binding protein
MARRRTRAIFAIAACTTLSVGLAACGGGDDNEGDSGNKDVTLTWWHNGTADPALGYWKGLADAYTKAHPNVKFQISAVQNEELQKTKIPAALQGGNPPDLFQQWGGGELSDQVAAGKVMDISDKVGPELDAIGGSVAGWQVEGKTYGLPFSMGVEGFWYNKDLFE